MKRRTGDLVFVPEAKTEEGLIVWWVGILAREGGATKADGGSYRRMGEKRKRKIEPGGQRGQGPGGMRPFVSARALEPGWEEQLPKEPIVTGLEPFGVMAALYQYANPFVREEHRLAA